jgi:hypothetical protein
MLYQHQTVAEKIHRIANPYFVNFVRGGKTYGTFCLCKRVVSYGSQKIKAFYVRYFSFKDVYRKAPVDKKGVTGGGMKGELKNAVVSVYDGDGLDVTRDEKFFHYAYVDPRNVRSVRLCKQWGFEQVRQYTSIVFNRLSPKESPEYKIIETVSHDDEVQALLSDFYKGYNTFSDENLLGRKYYLIRNKEGRVIAGVQANPDHWKIKSLPGLTGKLIGYFTYIPILNRLFSKDFRFLTLEAVYCAPEFETVLEKLFEGLLAKFGLNSAVILVDADSKLYATLRSLYLGWVDKLNKESRGHVYCRFTNFSEGEKYLFKISPVYISGIDAT